MLIALIPFTFWAVGDLIATFVARRVGGFAASYASILLVVVGLSFLLPQHLNDFRNYTTGLLLLNIFIGIVFLFGNQFYARALEKSNASLTNVVAGTFPIVTLLIAFMLGERISGVQGLGILFALVGVVIATINFKDIRQRVGLRDPGLTYAFLAMASWGVYYALIKPITEEVGWFAASYVTFLVFPVVYIPIRLQKIEIIKSFKIAGGLTFVLFLIAASLVRSGEVVMNSALQSNLSSLMTPLAGSYPVLFVVLAAIFLKEKIRSTQWLGVILGLIGIVILAFSDII